MKLPSHDDLDGARHIGDPPADAVVTALGRDAWTVNALLRHAHRNGDPLPAAVPAPVRELFESHASVPAWADMARIRRAQRWASRHLVPITVSLFCASLPTSYAAVRGARVLVATGRMDRAEVDRRVNETAQFVLDVLAEDGLGPRGAAIRAIQKVRLVHAAVRSHLVQHGITHGEVPINQEDQLGTLFTFSALVIRSVRRLGVVADEEVADDVQHLWRVAGAMLGVREDWIPDRHVGGLDLGRRIAHRQLGPSEHGRALMAVLLQRTEEHVPWLRSAPRVLVRHLIGDELAEHLGVPGHDDFHAVRAAVRLLPFDPARALSEAVARMSPVLGRPLLASIVGAKLGGEAATFAMPTRLRETSTEQPA